MNNAPLPFNCYFVYVYMYMRCYSRFHFFFLFALPVHSFEVWEDGIKVRLNGEGCKVEKGDEEGFIKWEDWEEID